MVELALEGLVHSCVHVHVVHVHGLHVLHVGILGKLVA